MNDLYFIRNVGCDDETRGLARLTDEQLAFLKNVIENLNKNSIYSCMPTIHVYRIGYDMIETIPDETDYNDIMYLDGQKVRFRGFVHTWTDEFEKRKVIG